MGSGVSAGTKHSVNIHLVFIERKQISPLICVVTDSSLTKFKLDLLERERAQASTQ